MIGWGAEHSRQWVGIVLGVVGSLFLWKVKARSPTERRREESRAGGRSPGPLAHATPQIQFESICMTTAMCHHLDHYQPNIFLPIN